MSSPTQRTLAHLRSQGLRAAVVEHWNPNAKIRQDLFGIVDVLAVGNGGTVAVQCTSDHNVASRVRKLSESDAIADLRAAGWTVEVHGWKKVGARWRLRVVDLS